MEKDLTCPFLKLTTQHLEVNLIFISRIQSKRTKCNFILNFKGKELSTRKEKGLQFMPIKSGVSNCISTFDHWWIHY